jgi:hypothetical protein
LLIDADIESYPVFLSTRDNGKIKIKNPSYRNLNYTISLAKIDSSLVMLDATEPWNNFNSIPSKCLNGYGLIVKKSKEDEWLQLGSNIVSEKKYEFFLQLNNTNDSILNFTKLTTTGYKAIEYRKSFSTDYKSLKKELIGNNDTPSDSLQVVNLKQTDIPFEIKFRKNYTVDSVANKIIITPFCNKTIESNPLKMKDRNYPVDMVYKNSNKFKSIIKIPNGYKLSSIPSDLVITNSLVNIFYKILPPENGIMMVQGFYDFKKDVYETADYNDLKSYFNTIVDKFNTKLEFVKE